MFKVHLVDNELLKSETNRLVSYRHQTTDIVIQIDADITL